MTFNLTAPYTIFRDTNGNVVNNGYVYVGTAGNDPKDAVDLFWDEAKTLPAPNPARTVNGYISRDGFPARIYVGSADYSLRVEDSNQDFVYSDLNVTGNNIEDTAADIDFVPAGTGAVTRSLQTKLREFVSVKDFGAVGDGTTDDRAAIQAALDSGAKRIYFPSGTYLVTRAATQTAEVFPQGAVLNLYEAINFCLAIPNDVALIGDNRETTTIKASATNGGAVLYANIKNDIMITGLTLDGASTGFSTEHPAIFCNSIERVTIRNCKIKNCTPGIFIGQGYIADVYIENIVMDDVYGNAILCWRANTANGAKSGNIYFNQIVVDNYRVGVSLGVFWSGIRNSGFYFEGDLDIIIRDSAINSFSNYVSSTLISGSNAIAAFAYNNFTIAGFTFKNSTNYSLDIGIFLLGVAANAQPYVSISDVDITNARIGITARDAFTGVPSKGAGETLKNVLISDIKVSVTNTAVSIIKGNNIIITASALTTTGAGSGSANSTGNKAIALSNVGEVIVSNCLIGNTNTTAAPAFFWIGATNLTDAPGRTIIVDTLVTSGTNTSTSYGAAAPDIDIINMISS